jgi:protein-L-isoaspartate(D-aspartate) O-methyltransferase
VLEIGTGTGFNTALLCHIVGAEHVVSIEYDAELAEAAGERLAALGFGQATVIAGDGAVVPDGLGPFDRIIATAGVWDIPRDWYEALEPGGLLLIPLSLHGPQVCAAFRRDAEQLTSESLVCCGFMPMEGVAAGPRAFRRLPDEPGTGFLEEWPESLPNGLLGELYEGAKEGERFELAAANGLQAGVSGEGAVWLALSGFRLIYVLGDEPGILVVTPERDGAVWLAEGGARASSGAARRRLGEAMAAFEALGQPPVERWSVVATPMAPREGEAVVEQVGAARFTLEKHGFRYGITLW